MKALIQRGLINIVTRFILNMWSKSIILSFIFVATFLFFNHAVKADNGWWNVGWKYRKQLTFQNSAQNENLNNFPVLVKLTASNFDFSKAQSTGYDIRFLDTDGNTELPYEIEKWDTAAQEAYVWVKVPQVDASSNSDYIYMYYGNSVAVNAQSTINVWDSNYAGVWHLKENGNGTAYEFQDSTNHANGTGGDGTSALGPTKTNSGKIDGGQSFGGNHYIGLGNNYSFERTNSFTVEGWAKANSLASRAIFAKLLAGAVATGYQLRLDSSGKYVFFLINSVSGNNYIKVTGDTTVATGTFYHVVATYDGSSSASGVKMYVNGVPQNLTVNSNTLTSSIINGVSARIGSGEFISNPFDGVLDEVRISTGVRSSAWVNASYKTQNDTLINYGSEDTYVHSTVNTQYVAQSSTEKPTCTNTAPAAPDLFQINTTKKSATLYFTPAGNPHNSYTISYGYDDNIERFGTGFSKMSSDGVQSYTINALSPNTKYFFKIRASNGCMPGPWSRTMMVKTGYSNSGFIFYAYNSVVKMINSIVY